MKQLFYGVICALLCAGFYFFGYSDGLNHETSDRVIMAAFCRGWVEGNTASTLASFEVDSLEMEMTLMKTKLK